MKKRFYALMMVMAMLAVTLVGCNKTTDTTNTTNDVTVNTEVEESGEVEVVEPEVEVPETEVSEVETTEEPTTEEDDFYSDSYQWAFPEGMEGFTDKFVLASDETMSFNCTHYVASNGNEMNFSWVGPTALGEKADAGNTTLFLYGDDSAYELRAWSFPINSEEDYLRSFDKTEIIEWDSDVTNYVVDDYYEFVDGTETARVIFKITRTFNDQEYIGYACYLDNYSNMVCYQITYLEKANVFDETRALEVVNSIDFWTYNPGENTTE